MTSTCSLPTRKLRGIGESLKQAPHDPWMNLWKLKWSGSDPLHSGLLGSSLRNRLVLCGPWQDFIVLRG